MNLNFDFNKIYAGKTYMKKGEAVPYKLSKDKFNDLGQLIKWFNGGSEPLDFTDAGKVFTRISEHAGWKAQKTRAEKLSLFATVMRMMGDEDLAQLHINPENKNNVLKAYSELAKEKIKEAPSTVNREKKRKSVGEEAMWSKEEHVTFVEQKTKRAQELIDKGIGNLSDLEKNELQECIVVLWYSVFRNVRALQGTIRKTGYGEQSNFIVMSNNVNHKAPIVIVYNNHKLNQGFEKVDPIVHVLQHEENPVLYQFILVQSKLWEKSPYLFNNYKSRNAFDEGQFRKYICKAHGEKIGARLLRIIEKTDFWESAPSLVDIEKELYETGQTQISQSVSYARTE